MNYRQDHRPPRHQYTEPAASKRAAAIGTAEDAVVVATGPGSEKIHGFIDNTDLFRIIEKGL